VPLQCEVLPDRPEAREKFLSAFGVAKAAHATLAFARRLVGKRLASTVRDVSRARGTLVVARDRWLADRFGRRCGDQVVADGGVDCVGNLPTTFQGSSSSIRLILWSAM
jgi:hypothetical protein